ncbi:Seripauperin and TIP1 family protein [Candida parapsilosis]|uniref:Seripauperin and TIP1 family protein n=1 Tax=Candida parapsilosis TaxID=5480 RepID=A0A8X7NR53_CANPA|nr:Seripauperin and TIP1 family protein [Candida parapsilosis]KAF6055588.1 Seripauperin and TIP1 family protein [Candida parapsilosis]KAF6058518.1 Seripauperin and TIP1 family protein [Candida parapsilosis]KAF6067275.1 Seripauperin and TIP1 family protein [Candida parapsilosis]KAI5905676.1 Uncharacterized protein K4G60_g4936 [Candida parapsilosis]
MQFISLVYVLPCLFATTIAQSVSFNTEQQEALLTKVASDIRSYPSEYVDFFKTQSEVALPLDLLSLRRFSTYTDDSYTTIVENSELMSDLENVVTRLPWYNSRIAGNEVPSVTTDESSESGSSSSNLGVKLGGGLLAGLVGGVLLAL